MSKQAGFRFGMLLVICVMVACLAALLLGAREAHAAGITVTSNADSGPGSLRAAVATANDNGEADTITFNLPAGGRTITLASQIEFTAPQPTTVDGGEAGVTVSGGGSTRVFSVSGGNLSIERLTVSGGNTNGLGGGIFNERGTLNVADSTVSDNTASEGGGIFNAFGTTNVTDSTISANSATRNGGGLFNLGGTLNVTDSTVSDNTASEGGGILSRNSRDGSDSTTIVNSTISGNTATNRGGGVYNADGLTNIRSTTVTNNTAPAGEGGGVASTGEGVGAMQNPPTTEISSSIISGNSATDVDFVGGTTNSFASGGSNVIGDGNAAGTFDQPADQTGVNNPALGPLSDNGGPTNTHALLEGSPAIDAVEATACPPPAADQRGVARPRDGNGDGTPACDAGSFEREPPPPVNQEPTARDDRATTGFGRAVAIRVLSNDSDADGQLDRSTLQVTDQAANGRARVNGNGTITYAPDRGFSGRDTFRYRICDSGAPRRCDTATVIVRVAAPRADLRIKVNAPRQVRQGDNFVYTMRVTNNGPNRAQGVTTVSRLPRGVRLVRSPNSCDYRSANRTLTCDLGSMPDNAKKTRKVVLKATGRGSVRLTSCVRSVTLDQNRANNRDRQ